MDRAIFEEGTTIRKRSVFISGHHTSVSIEDAFWLQLKTIGRQKKRSITQIIAEVDRMRTGNLSSAIRVYILSQMMDAK